MSALSPDCLVINAQLDDRQKGRDQHKLDDDVELYFALGNAIMDR
jgi:hypothetical protein